VICKALYIVVQARWSCWHSFYPIGGIMKAIATLIAGLFAAGVAFAQAPAAPAKDAKPAAAPAKKEEKKEVKKDEKKEVKKDEKKEAKK